jgi:hypothetical protein
MNKRYVLPNGDEIIDVSGVKPIEQISAEFNKPVENLVLTPEYVAPVPTQEELDAITAEKAKEDLIQAKVREFAISELKKDGKLDEDGNVVKE